MSERKYFGTDGIRGRVGDLEAKSGLRLLRLAPMLETFGDR